MIRRTIARAVARPVADNFCEDCGYEWVEHNYPLPGEAYRCPDERRR